MARCKYIGCRLVIEYASDAGYWYAGAFVPVREAGVSGLYWCEGQGAVGREHEPIAAVVTVEPYPRTHDPRKPWVSCTAKPCGKYPEALVAGSVGVCWDHVSQAVSVMLASS